MRVKSLLCNSDFIINCEVKIFNATKGDYWFESNPIYSGNLEEDISEDIQNMLISYIGINNGVMIIEAVR